ncbi:carbonic anhydrase family protein [Undibacterium sp. RTI2.1]|uniref:carbonic anhydrase n=1 Tax=unclassified Undibacterium TaxID=2630295 RepID=UPI002AB36BAC|nr:MULTISPECIES: carbonic anhydrase family protein [unclassified Undibacterium]MDY7539907.1 carbonic anhydrase family protein [Undibacterium sp. 5I1]MEB0031182.1 carbonic anhydrase family protein [Undibacterium sp. RTI2.1]MEB0116418.1 carbonic anhydrase family protein [Undibacterium sp. RTI2.2]MEB0230514.1 carbonic anhydrase family protein [Undibacterium sp. 10I3]MEB0257212.1 carbonic anhydrase family protein [Undibacterium sp. 5I1]
MMRRLIAVLIPVLLCAQVQANDEPTPSKPIKPAAAKEEASVKDEAKPAAKEKDSKDKEPKETKESKAAAAARAKEALAADELAAKIADKLAIIRKEKEETSRSNPKAMARSYAYAPPVRKPVSADTSKEKIMDSRGMTMSPNGSMASSKPVQWSYEGEGGPLNWGKISPANAKCDSGERQSPIDIRDGIRVDLAPISFDYKPAGFRVTDTGHTIQVNLGPGNYITVNGRSFELVQFHFHKPAEERVNGKGFEMVVHLVHKDADGKLAILAVLIERGKPHSLVQSVWNNLPLEKNDSMQGPAAMDLNEILPAKRDYYTFMGSLTEPPCTEGVLWLVMKEPIEISAEQLAIFNRLYPMNARPIQKTSGRLIKESN